MESEIIPECPSYEWNNMGGKIIPAQIWIEQERGNCLPLAICPPPHYPTLIHHAEAGKRAIPGFLDVSDMSILAIEYPWD